MKRFGYVLISAFAVGSFGCSSSSTEDAGAPDGAVDGAITFDAGDIGLDMPRPVDMRVPMCGDGVLDPGESCDDGHLLADAGTPPAGCNAMCRRTSFCGDNHVDPGEACDDGENFACDGCAPNCQLEECGNHTLDCGEICDGTPGCLMTGAAACTSVTTCGNMAIDPGEQCDPTMTTMPASFDGDGCQKDCLLEQDLVIDTLQINATGGCDFSGDGRPDNAFGRAFGPAATFLNMQIQMGIANGNALILLSIAGLNDTTATTDPDVRVAWLQGMDADMDPMNNLMGMGTFYAAMGSFDSTGTPNTTFNAAIASHMLSGGPEDVAINLGALPIPLDLRQARLTGTLAAAMMSVTDLSDGQLCGAIPVSSLASLPNFLGMISMGMAPPPCDMTVADSNLGDVLVGGASVFGLRIGGVQPDVDLDHDGLEHFEITGSPTGTMCQAVITACIDGDGTRIAGHDCVTATVGGHPRFNDGWSSSIGLTAVHASILGVR